MSEPKINAPPRIVIVCDGGVIQDVLSDSPVWVVDIDYDNDGGSDCFAIDQGDGTTALAELDDFKASVDPKFVEYIHGLNAERLKDPRFRHTIGDWRDEVRDKNTVLGYEEWLEHKVEEEANEPR